MVTQMNFIDQFFETNSNVLAERLQASGYSAKQANNFLAETESAILQAHAINKPEPHIYR